MHRMKRRTAETYKFQRSMHKRNFLTLCTYTAWSIARLLSRCYNLTATSYKYLEFGINAGPPSYVEIVTELRGKLSRTRTVAVSRNMEGSLRAIMEYLQDAAKRIQGQFYKRWTANRQCLHTERCYVSILHPYAIR